MNHNIQCLIQACKKLKVKYEFIDVNNNLVKVYLNNKFYYFNNARVPLNDRVTAIIAKDKEFTYTLIKDIINCPKTIGYLDPSVEKGFKQYLKFKNIEDIIENIKAEFEFPFILKKNRGERAINVFTINDTAELSDALSIIINQNSKDYDYIALAQEKIEVKKEFRVMVVGGEIQFIYCKKELVDNKFKFKQEDVTDERYLRDFSEIIAKISIKLSLDYMAIDLAEDFNGKIFLLEINSSPSFTRYSKINGNQNLIKVYEKVLEKLNTV